MYLSFLLPSLLLWSFVTSVPISDSRSSISKHDTYQAEVEKHIPWTPLKTLKERGYWIKDDWIAEDSHEQPPKMTDLSIRAEIVKLVPWISLNSIRERIWNNKDDIKEEKVEEWYITRDNPQKRTDMYPMLENPKPKPFSDVKKIKYYYQIFDTSKASIRLIFYGSDNELIQYSLLDAKSMWDFRKQIYKETGFTFKDWWAIVDPHVWMESENSMQDWNKSKFEQSIHSILSLNEVVFESKEVENFNEVFFDFADITSIVYQYYELPKSERSQWIRAKVAVFLYGGPKKIPLTLENFSNTKILFQFFRHQLSRYTLKNTWTSGPVLNGVAPEWRKAGNEKVDLIVLNIQMYSNPGLSQPFYAPKSVAIDYKKMATEAEVDNASAS